MKEMDLRRQRRMNKAVEEKTMISLWKRKVRLFDGKRALGKVELPKPIRKGFKRTFVLRDDVAKSKEAAFFNGLLKHVNTTQYCHDKKFLAKHWKTKKYVPMKQGLKSIEHREWNKLNFTPKQAACFDKVWVNDYNHRLKKIVGGRFVFVFKKDWVFVTKIEPYYITHVIVIDPDLERELKEVSNKIETNNLWPKIAKAFGWRWNESYGYDEVRKRLINKFIKKNTELAIANFGIEYEDTDYFSQEEEAQILEESRQVNQGE